MTGVRLDIADGVARVMLDRPDVGNAIDIPLARALMKAAIACDESSDVRCVLLTGAGKLFCAGGDIRAFEQAGDEIGAFMKEVTGYLHTAISRFARMDKPLVTAVNGPAAGAGFSLAILGDLALAAPSASFSLAYSGLGLSPDGGSSWLLPRLVGLRRAQELCLRNTRVTAHDAAAIGLVTRVVEGDLQAEASALAAELAAAPTSALGAARRLLIDSFSNTFETQMELESRSMAAQSRTPEGREGVARFLAYVARRPPSKE
jgi:2-(1,2-epoxy-1,2-dihydrophenyl)acetyl-CoA isomerase